MDKLYGLTNPQKNIWNTEKFFEGTTINNVCSLITLHEKVDPKLLVETINNIVKNNDSIRIQIKKENGVPLQYISEFKPFNKIFWELFMRLKHFS